MRDERTPGRLRGPCGLFSARGFWSLYLPAALQLPFPVGLFHFALCRSLFSLWPPSRVSFFVSASVYLSSCLSRPFPCPNRAKRTLKSWRAALAGNLAPGSRTPHRRLCWSGGSWKSKEIYASRKSKGICEEKTDPETFGSFSVWTNSGQGGKWQE